MHSGLLQPYGNSIWIGAGPIVRAFGFPFPTRMIVVKLAGGGVWINSPVDWAPEEMEIVALGDAAPPEWNGDLDQLVFRGSRLV